MLFTDKVEVLADELDVDVTLIKGGRDGLGGLQSILLVATQEFSAHALIVGLETEELFCVRKS
jgi:hypothetical protein